LVTLDDSQIGKVTIPNVCPRLSDTPGRVKWAGRALGADTEEILKDWLGQT
jgi:crotonobetainyl-CoA:carnitine CoA-transferase CaiB-like acyl-CoA transferase